MDWLMDTFFLNDWRVAFIIIAAAIYIYQTWNFDHFKNIGLENPKAYPFLGTSYIFMTSLPEKLLEYSRKYGKVFGLFSGRTPEYVISDEQLLKEIMVTQFSSFPDHLAINFGDKYVDRVLTSLTGDEWRRVRHLSSPAFTKSRLKRMTGDLNSCCEEMVKSIGKALMKDKEVDMRDLGGNFTMDVISKTAFGLQTDTQVNPENEFVKHGKMVMIPEGFSIRSIVLMFVFLCPSIVPYLTKIGLQWIPKKCTDFFCGIVDHLLQLRENEIENRNDFISMVAHSNKKKHTSDKSEVGKDVDKELNRTDIISLGFVFFLAGFETVASGLSVCCYHMAANPEWQEKVLDEIEEIIGAEDNITYDNLDKLPLLSMCIDESFRFSSPAAVTDRVASTDVVLNGLTLKKGTHIWIPIHAIHHDPDYYPDPERFDPMRFTAEAKAARSKYVYLPFGMGPRDCIGKRLAMMELKMALAYLLRSFKISSAGGDKKHMKTNPIGEVQKAYIAIEKRIK